MLMYPVPLLSVVPELDFGSARISKLAPYWSAANAKGAAQMERTPVIVLPDVDHSDMCHGFHVPGDLPSASSASKAISTITGATKDFMLSHILQDAAAKTSMQAHLDFTKPIMESFEQALSLDLRSAKWCEEVAKTLAGPFADKVSVVGSYFTTYADHPEPWAAPSAKLGTDGKVVLNVTGRNAYEQDGGLWPPGAVPSTPAGFLSSSLGVPPPMRDTATSLGCRLVSQTKIASLLGKKVQEPEDFCQTANKAAWQWALDHAPARVLKRYHSKIPCTGCAPGVPIVFQSDSSTGKEFVNQTLSYDLTNKSLTLKSPAYVTPEEHSCHLLSPARALDFLFFDAYSASIYAGAPSQSAAATILI